MKKSLTVIALLFLLFSCDKKEEVQTTTKETQDSLMVNSPESEPAEIAPADQNIRIKALDAVAEKGVVVFKNNNLVMISFDNLSQTGKIIIDGKEYALDKLAFSENNYQISGPQIKIIAENGNFKEMTSDCLYGNFPNVKISVNNENINLTNIDVQDCPAY